MAGIVSSRLALRIALALTQSATGSRMAELARDLRAPYSSVEKAVGVLETDGIVERREHHYLLAPILRSDAVVRMALAFLDPTDLLAATARSNPAVEFCGYDRDGSVIVMRRFADPADEAALARILDMLREDRAIDIEVVDKARLRDRPAVESATRQRARQMQVITGSVDRSFPDRSRHGDPGARPLGRLHPSLATPSQRRLQALARRYHLKRLEAFGSATRADFRPDSDVDLLIETKEGHRPRLGDVVRLNSEMEELFGRDVDLLAGPLPPELRDRIDRDAVTLYDAGR